MCFNRISHQRTLGRGAQYKLSSLRASEKKNPGVSSFSSWQPCYLAAQWPHSMRKLKNKTVLADLPPFWTLRSAFLARSVPLHLPCLPATSWGAGAQYQGGKISVETWYFILCPNFVHTLSTTFWRSRIFASCVTVVHASVLHVLLYASFEWNHCWLLVAFFKAFNIFFGSLSGSKWLHSSICCISMNLALLLSLHSLI